jgi:anthraniloyl-CoA monooxygenase
MSSVITTYRLTDTAVSAMLDAATAKARELASPSGIGIVDAGGALRGWLLMDGATQLSYDAVLKKARTAAFTGRPSGGLPAELAVNLALAISEFANLPGGFPIVKDGETIGAIGAGGGTHEADAAVGEAALLALDFAGSPTAHPEPTTPPQVAIAPYLTVKDGTAAGAFYRDVFGADQVFLRPTDSGGVAHLTLGVNGGLLMLSDDPEWGGWADLPQSEATAVGWLAIETSDCNATYAAALANGATEDLAPEDKPWGHRYARFRDPFGQLWSVHSQIQG